MSPVVGGVFEDNLSLRLSADFCLTAGSLRVYRFVAFRCLCVTKVEKRGRFSLSIGRFFLYSCFFGDFACSAWLLLFFVDFDVLAFV